MSNRKLMPDSLMNVLIALIVAAITGGIVWVQDMGTRVAIVEDDLTETVEIVSILHPPRVAEASKDDVVLTGSDAEKKSRKRSKLLESLKRQTQQAPNQQAPDGKTEICDNMLDDDLDEKIDCADDDCVKWPGCSPHLADDDDSANGDDDDSARAGKYDHLPTAPKPRQES